jgi:hypothetical protein
MYFSKIIFFTLIFFICSFSGSSFSQDEKKSIKLQFAHQPPKQEELPNPGLPLKLLVRVNKEVLVSGVSLRAIISRDGNLFEQLDIAPEVDATDKVFFKIEIPSPLVELNYQFLFSDKAGNAVGTKRYQVQRACLPNIVFPLNSSKDPTAEQLRAQGDQLENEIVLLDFAAKTLIEIQDTIDKK